MAGFFNGRNERGACAFVAFLNEWTFLVKLIGFASPKDVSLLLYEAANDDLLQ